MNATTDKPALTAREKRILDALKDLTACGTQEHDDDYDRPCSIATPDGCALCAARRVIEDIEPGTEPDEEHEAEAGRLLADALGLKRSPDHSRRWTTSYGTKTDTGLFRTLASLIDDARAGRLDRLRP